MAKNKKKAAKSKPKSNQPKQKPQNQSEKKVEKKKVDKNVLTEVEITNIINNTNDIINKLNKEKKNPFLLKKKQLINQQINYLKKCLDHKEYYVLKNNLEKLQVQKNNGSETNANLKQGEDNKVVLNKWQLFLAALKDPIKFKAMLKNFNHYPLYSRIKKWKNLYEKKDLYWRIGVLVGILLLLILLMITGIILFIFDTSLPGDTQMIFPAFLVILSFILIFFL